MRFPLVLNTNVLQEELPVKNRGAVEAATPEKLIRPRTKQRANRSFVRIPIALPNKTSCLTPIFPIKNGNWQRAAPSWQHCQTKRLFVFGWIPPVVGKYRLIACNEPPHQY